MKLIIKLLAVMLVASPLSSRAATVLGLAIDRSGSISDAEYALQINAYINVLSDITVLPRDGSVAIGLYTFGADVDTIFNAAFITNANHASLIASLTTSRSNTGSTALGPAIAVAAADLLALDPLGNHRYVIDVSTDGAGNTGVNQITARNEALADGIDQINGLGVGAGANLNFVGGTGSFGVQVASFNDFETAIERKITREVRGVPEGGPGLVLSGILFAGLAGLRMKMRSAKAA